MLLIEECLHEMNADIKPDNSLYFNEIGQNVPRVTDILSKTIFEVGLMYWANSLGFKRLSYSKELNKAAEIGTKAHAAIETFFECGFMTPSNPSFNGFLGWWNSISKNNKVELVSFEKRLVCQWFGGTLDALIKINGKYFLIDFKTSKHITYKHFIQLAAYRYMLYTLEGINIQGCIILQLDKESECYEEYVLDLSDTNHYNFIESCTNCFLSLVYSYYNTTNVKEQYVNIFGRAT